MYSIKVFRISHKIDDDYKGQTQGKTSNLNPKAIFDSNQDNSSLKDLVIAPFKNKYKELEKFFMLFLSCLTVEEAEILFKMMLKLFSLPKGTTMTQFQSFIEHDLEDPDEVKMIASYDTFKWTLSNWKACFTKSSEK